MSLGNLIYSRPVQKLRKAQDLLQAAGIAMKAGFRRSPPVFADVGARWGLPRKWSIMYHLGFVIPIMFEPDPSEAAELRKRYRTATVVETALGSETRTGYLNIMREPGRSSLRMPNVDQLAEIFSNMDSFEVVNRVPVPVTRLDDIRDQFPPPDFIKIDTQGYDLDVLIGGDELLTSILCIEIEVQLINQYEGQALFHDIYDHLRCRGFGLVAFRPIGLPDARGLIEANAFFTRPPRDARETTGIGFWQALMGIPSHNDYCAMSG